MLRVPRPELDKQLNCLLEELEVRMGPHARTQLSQDTIGILGAWPDITMLLSPAPAGRTGCEVAGAFLATTVPPTLVVAQALSAGREAFTALHEFAHFLQATTDTLGERLIVQPDHGQALEEAACDAFAAEILVPEQTASVRLAGGATASGVRNLWLATTASRSAVSVAASRHLSAPGHVTVLDANGCVVIDATAGEPRVTRGTDLSAAPAVARALAAPEHRATGRLQYPYGGRWMGAELYAQIGDLDGHLVVVAVTDHAPWVSFSPTAAHGPTRTWWSCEHCPNEFPIAENTCGRCKSPKCPECGGCRCSVREQTCTSCFLVRPAAMFAGKSTECTECTE